MSGVGCRQNCDQAARLTRELLAKKGALRFEQIVGPILEECAIRTTHLKDVLCVLRSEGVVDFPQPTKRHKPKEGMTIRWTGGGAQERTSAYP